MNEIGIIFSEAFEARVKLSIESAERELHAILKIKENKLPLLHFDNFSSEYNGPLKLSESEKQKIKCRSELKTYTLINCETNGDIIYLSWFSLGRLYGCCFCAFVCGSCACSRTSR
jgi:hypothetical protein